MYPSAYIQYLLLFHVKRDYFECHEVLEEYWKGEGRRNPIWVGFIQFAVLFYHYRRNNLSGAKRLAKRATTHFKNERKEVERLGVDSDRILDILRETEESIEKGLPYKPVSIPIVHKGLIALCNSRCKEFGKGFTDPQEINDPSIIHKHRCPNRLKGKRKRSKET